MTSSIEPARPPEREYGFGQREFRYLAGLVYARSGIVLPDHKAELVYARLVRRLRALGLRSFAEYCGLLQSAEGDGEVAAMINAITTNVTQFFREPHHFEHLAAQVLAPRRASGERRLRIWSAGCSTGEEPYSIAMTVLATLGDLRGWDARVLATDLDTAVLARAAAARYPADAARHLPAQVQRYVEPAAGGELEIAAAVRALVTLKPLNLLEEWPMRGPFDAIFCRNVMIYFDQETKTNLVARYAALLAPGGFLYVGHSESLLDCRRSLVPAGRTTYRKAP